MTRLTILKPTLLLAMCCLARPALAELIGGVEFPNGQASFADAVVNFSPVINSGQPTAPHLVPENTIGIPDYDGVNSCGADCSFASLGDGGSLTLQFLDNVLTGSGDTGYDIWIFEVGPDVEDTFVEISVDGAVWHAVGKVFGATAGINIDAYGFGPDAHFSFIRLTDDGSEGAQTGNTVGADIDAVGAIATQLDCSILSVSPPFPWSVGQPITIVGAGFLEGAVPLVGGVEAAPYVRVSSGEIQATIPALIDGEYILQVSVPGQLLCEYELLAVDAEAKSWGAVKSMYR